MKKLLTIALLAAAFFLPGQAFALSCAEIPSPEDAFNQYDGVIMGTVTAIQQGNREKILTIHVDKSYKGVEQNYIRAEEDIDWGDSRVNETYLYYLNKEGGDWVHPLCSPTTTDTAIADEVYEGKETLALQSVVLEDNETDYTAIVITLAVLLPAAVAVPVIRSSRKG